MEAKFEGFKDIEGRNKRSLIPKVLWCFCQKLADSNIV